MIYIVVGGGVKQVFCSGRRCLKSRCRGSFSIFVSLATTAKGSNKQTHRAHVDCIVIGNLLTRKAGPPNFTPARTNTNTHVLHHPISRLRRARLARTTTCSGRAGVGPNVGDQKPQRQRSLAKVEEASRCENGRGEGKTDGANGKDELAVAGEHDVSRKSGCGAQK